MGAVVQFLNSPFFLPHISPYVGQEERRVQELDYESRDDTVHGKSARLSPTRDGFAPARCHMQVAFVSFSLLANVRGFSSGSLVFLQPQKQTSPNSNFTRTEDPHEAR